MSLQARKPSQVSIEDVVSSDIQKKEHTALFTIKIAPTHNDAAEHGLDHLFEHSAACISSISLSDRYHRQCISFQSTSMECESISSGERATRKRSSRRSDYRNFRDVRALPPSRINFSMTTRALWSGAQRSSVKRDTGLVPEWCSRYRGPCVYLCAVNSSSSL